MASNASLFGLLGDIEIELTTSPRSWRVGERSKFAEHPKIESKPFTQWVGDDLNELQLAFRFSAHWCDPDKQIRQLRAARLKHSPMRLVVGNNVFKGNYVIEEVQSEIRNTDSQGAVVTVDVDVRLRETIALASGSSSANKSPFVRRR